VYPVLARPERQQRNVLVMYLLVYRSNSTSEPLNNNVFN